MTLDISNAENKKTWLLHSTAGACSGAFTRLACQPFDVLKIRFQVNLNCLPGSWEYLSLYFNMLYDY